MRNKNVSVLEQLQEEDRINAEKKIARLESRISSDRKNVINDAKFKDVQSSALHERINNLEKKLEEVVHLLNLKGDSNGSSDKRKSRKGIKRAKQQPESSSDATESV